MTRLGARAVAAAAVWTALAVDAPARAASTPSDPPEVVVGSKAFPESWILGDALAMLAEEAGARAAHRRNLGGTEIVFEALRGRGIDAYVEYTGTLAEVILGTRGPLPELRARLSPLGIGVSEPLGFEDNYAIAVTADAHERRGLGSLSDLAHHPEIRLGLTHEFLGRADGYPGLVMRYGLASPNVRGMQHELAFEAMANGQIDGTDVYTTDAQIARLGLFVLADDRRYFPRYQAVVLFQADLPDRAPAAFASMMRLVGSLEDSQVAKANARVVLDRRESADAAASLLAEALGDGAPHPRPVERSIAREIAIDTVQHMKLVGLSLLAAIVLGLPLGVLATRSRAVASVTLSAAGLLQTIPSLALLALLIPLFGVGAAPAIVALFLYSLLPIVRNTHAGIAAIPPALSESAEALGLSRGAKLRRITLPMASPSIMAGIKTSAVINVGTATLAALVGGEGLGNPILQGIALRDPSRILQGAVPAALLALVVQAGFDGLDRVVVPKGLRLTPRA